MATVWLLDTNVLMLWVVGNHDPDRIARFKRTDVFSPQHFAELQRLVGMDPVLATTAPILAEASNLMRRADDLHAALFATVADWREEVVPLRDVTDDPALLWLGYADVVTLHAARRVHVITKDLPLSIELATRELPVTRFPAGIGTER